MIRFNVGDFIDGTITRDQFWSLMKFKYPAHQIVFALRSHCNVCDSEEVRLCMSREIGRENRESNALFYLCSLIEFVARLTKNRRGFIVAKLGELRLRKILDLADIYHSDNIERVAADFIAESGIEIGSYDNISRCRYSVPSYWDIGKVYKRLIIKVSKDQNVDLIAALRSVYDSFISEKIDDYNSSVYYDSPESHIADFKMGSLSADQ